MNTFLWLFFVLIVTHCVSANGQQVDASTIIPGYTVEEFGTGLEGQDVYMLAVNGDALYVAADTGGIFQLDLNKGVDAEWKYVGLSGIDCREVAVHPDNPDFLLVGAIPRASGQSRIYRSVDGGQSWEGADEGLVGPALLHKTLPSTSKIRFHPTDPDMISIAHVGAWAPHFSTNGGQSWAPFQSEVLETTSVNDILWDPNDPEIMYAAGEGFGLTALFFKSTDGGKTWDQKITHENLSDIGGESAVDVIQFSPYDPDLIVLGTEGFFLRSTDRGESWTVAPGQRTEHYQTTLNWDYQDANLVFSTGGGYSGSQRELGGVYMSEDAGATWLLVATDSWWTVESGISVPHIPKGLIFTAAYPNLDIQGDTMQRKAGVFVFRPSSSSVVASAPAEQRISVEYVQGGRFTIRNGGQAPRQDYTLQMYDALGRVVDRFSVSAGVRTVTLQSIAPGLYLYEFAGRDEEIKGTGKVLVW